CQGTTLIKDICAACDGEKTTLRDESIAALSSSTPETWLDQQLKQAKAEGAMEELGKLSEAMDKTIALNSPSEYAERDEYCMALRHTQIIIGDWITEIRKEAGLGGHQTW